MKKIAVFGGSFNPVHNGHVKIAAEALVRLDLDKVIFVPAKIQPFKRDEKQESETDRYNMLVLATKQEPRFFVSDFELSGEGVSYSYITAEYFKTLYPNDKLYFILGADAYADIDRWKEPERLKNAAEFIVFPRQGNQTPRDAVYINIAPIEISSSGIRNMLKNNLDVAELIPDEVLQYIKSHNLYK